MEDLVAQKREEWLAYLFGACRRRNGPYYPTKPPQNVRYIVNYNVQFTGIKHETTKNRLGVSTDIH